MNKKVVAAVIIVVVLVAMALAIVHRKRQLANMAPPANPPVPVATATVRQGEASDSVATVALIQSETSATVSAQASCAAPFPQIYRQKIWRKFYPKRRISRLMNYRRR